MLSVFCAESCLDDRGGPIVEDDGAEGGFVKSQEEEDSDS